MVKALIDKKSAIYSDRPPSYVSHELITQGDHLLMMNHGERWRLIRKLVYQTFNESKCEKEHVTLQNAEAVQLLKDCLVEPEGLMEHPKRFANSIIMSLGKFHLRRWRRKKLLGSLTEWRTSSDWHSKRNIKSPTFGGAF